MKQIITKSLMLCLALFGGKNLMAQLSGSIFVPLQYPTIGQAIADLNAQGVGTGGITINISAGYTESITTNLVITATGTSANPIVFQKNGAGANPVIARTDAGSNATSTLGGQGDGIITIQGGDFITFDGLDLTSSNSSIEYGYFFRKASATDGCKNVTIKNSTITMTKGTSAYVTGIYVSNLDATSAVSASTGVTVSSTGGRHENITITGSTISSVFYGILLRGFLHSSAPYDFYDQNITIGAPGAGNTIQNFAGNTTTTNYGIYAIYSNNVTIQHNNINNTSGGGTAATGVIYGVFITTNNATLYNVNNNTVSLTSSSTSGAVIGLYNAGSTGNLNINNNTISINNTTSSSGTYAFIYNAGTSTVATAYSISGNSFAASSWTGTGTAYLIYNTPSTTAIATIQGNITTGPINKLGNSSLYIYYNVSATGGSDNIYGNNFSNISIAGTSALLGIHLATSSGHTHNIYQNTISNITIGSGTSYAINSSAAAIRNIYENNISGLSGTGTIIPITSGTGTTAVNIYRNKITDISTSGATGGVYGIQLTSGTANNVHNNLIGNLFAPSLSDANGIRGINITSTLASSSNNISYNTIFLSGGSTGANFGSSCLFHTTSTTATTAELVMRNNVFVNNSTPAGTGLAVAYRRSSTTLTNFSVLSDRNLFYGGTPGAANLIFTDGTNNHSTLAAYKTAMATRDQNSYTENPTFISTTGSSPDFLHVNPIIPTQIESGGIAISGLSTDYDGQIRFGSTGYLGTGSAPDLGADEGNFIIFDLTPPAISYPALSFTCSFGNRTLTNVTITDIGGVPVTGTLVPRVYYRKNSGTWFSQPGTLTFGNANNGNWSFQILAADMGGIALGDVIEYYVIAQDNSGNIGSNASGAVASNVNTVSTHPASPTLYNINPSLTAGTYTVGSGGNYQTLTAAVADYNAKCVSGNVMFSLTDAVYSTAETFPIIINANPDASAFNTLTIKPATGITSTITGSVNANHLIRIRGQYVTIDGSNNSTTTRNLTISNTSITTPQVVSIGSNSALVPASNITLRNCIIENGVNTSTGTIIGDGAGATAGYFNNITIQNNFVQRSYIGIYSIAVPTSGNGSGLNITQNDFTNSGGYSIRYIGIYVQGVDGANVSQNNLANFDISSGEVDRAIWFATATVNSTISNNTIYSLGAPSGGSFTAINITSAVSNANVSINNNTIYSCLTNGTTASHGISVTSTTTGVNILNNKIYDLKGNNTSGAGVYGINLASTTLPSNIMVANNFISDIASYGSATLANNGHGIYISSGSAYKFIYNSIALNSNQTLSTGISSPFVVTSGVTAANALEVRNNIFSSTQTTGNPYSIYSTAANSVFNPMNNNSYYSTPNLGFIVSNRVTIGDIQSGFGGNANSILHLPVFVGLQDLHIIPSSNAPLDGAGSPDLTITSDIDGDIRNATNPDIGADEFMVNSLDIAISGMTSQNICNGSQNVQVNLQNLGTTTITSATITWSMNGGTPTVVNLTGLSIPAGTSAPVSLGAFNFFGNVMYNFSATTSLPNGLADQNTANDLYTKTIKPQLSGTYIVGSTGDFTTLSSAINAYNTNGICGPLVFSLTDAAYNNEQYPITLNHLPNASSTNTLTIGPATGINAVFSGNNSLGLIKLNGADFVTIDGSNNSTNSRNLSFINNSTAGPVIWNASLGGVGNGANNNTFKNIIVTAGSPSTNSAYGIVSSATTSTGTACEDNDQLRIENCRISRAYYGISALTSSTATLASDNLQILDNVIGDVDPNYYVLFKGIQISYANNASITGNKVFNLKSTILSDNIAGIEVQAGVPGCIVDRNDVSGVYNESTGGWGAYGINFSSATGTTSPIISNNFISDIRTINYTSSTTYSAFGIRYLGGANAKFYHNSINLYGNVSVGSSTGSIAANLLIASSSSTGLDIRNNIFSNTMTFAPTNTTAAIYNVYVSSGAITTINNNDYYGTSGGGTTYHVGYATSNRTSLANWQTYTTQDGASINNQPIFDSPTDLHMSNVGGNLPFDGTGSTSTGILNDIDNTLRAAFPDLGADEFNLTTCPGSNGGSATALLTSFCGSGATTIASSGYSTGIGASFQWEYSSDNFNVDINNLVGQTNPLSANTGTISTTTYYRLKVTCTITSTTGYSNIVVVTVNPNPTASVTPGTVAPICEPATQLFSSTTSANTPQYQWMNNAIAISGQTNSTYTANLSGNYSVLITELATGCNTLSNSVQLTVNPRPTVPVITPNSGTICAGTIQQLTASGSTFNSFGQVGTQTGLQVGGGTNGSGLTPYSIYYEGNRSQYLILASELNALGINAGDLTSLAFNVISPEPGTFNQNGFTIKLGHTTATNLSTGYATVIGNLVTTYGPVNLPVPVAGWNNYTFVSPFSWDGISNVVLDICHDNDINNSCSSCYNNGNSSVEASTTPFVSVYGRYADNVQACGSLSTSTASGSNRPNMRFGYTGSSNYTWTPITGLFTDPLATVAYTGTVTNTVYAQPTSTTTYAANAVSLAGCTNGTNIPLTVTQPAVITTQPASTVSICSGNSVLLNVIANGASGYQWYKGVTPLTNGGNISGATSANLVISNAATSDVGTYSVVVTSANAPCSNVTSSNSTVSVTAMSSALASNGSSNIYSHTDGVTNTYTDASCNPILRIQDATGGNILGSVNTNVTVLASVQTANGQPYVQRYYSVTPTSNGPATVTLYATQTEFNNYNIHPAAASYPQLPSGGINNGSVRVSKFTGASPAPGGTLITPTSVVWNVTNNWWEITFPVTSFSSFFIHTGTTGPLDIVLKDIAAINTGERNRVDWITLNEKSANYFELERSADGLEFDKLAVVTAKGEASQYSYWDELPFKGGNFYRLKMFDGSGNYSYSKVVDAFVGGSRSFAIGAYPNPVNNELTIKVNGTIGNNAVIMLTDVTGKLIRKMEVKTTETTIAMNGYAQGVYFIKYQDEFHQQTIKISKQ